MRLIYGTKNPAKLNGMKSAVKNLDIEITGLDSILHDLVEPEESGNDPLENASIKALKYYEQLKTPVFSCDSGLYFKEVEAHEQPGVAIRRINGKRLNDEEMILYYSQLAKKYGGRLTAYYKNAICVILDEKTRIQYDGESICSEPFYIVDLPHKSRTEGFPLNALSVEIDSNKYYNDLRESSQKSSKVMEGFYAFFKKEFVDRK